LFTFLSIVINEPTSVGFYHTDNKLYTASVIPSAWYNGKPGLHSWTGLMGWWTESRSPVHESMDSWTGPMDLTLKWTQVILQFSYIFNDLLIDH